MFQQCDSDATTNSDNKISDIIGSDLIIKLSELSNTSLFKN